MLFTTWAGDEADDFAVAAPREDVSGITDQRRVYVFSGADQTLLLTLEPPNPSGFEIFGAYVVGLADVDADSRPDLAEESLLSAPRDVIDAHVRLVV